MAQVMLYLFGTPRVAKNGASIELNLRKGLALLAYLAVTRQPQSRDTLATLLWPEKDQQAARSNLRRTVYELGQLLMHTFNIVSVDRDISHEANAFAAEFLMPANEIKKDFEKWLDDNPGKLPMSRQELDKFMKDRTW